MQADAKADAAERAAAQSHTLEALLEIFFRVLKQCTASGLLKPGVPSECVADVAYLAYLGDHRFLFPLLA